MIVVAEGMDNAGKTTLAQVLAKKLRAVYIKVERPKNGGDLQAFQRLLYEAEEYSGWVIADRHVAISEPIYGNICRGGHDLNQNDIEACIKGIDAIIYCRPPLPTIISSIDERDQMEGVVENTTRLVDAYDEAFSRLYSQRGESVYPYNYLTQKPEAILDSLLLLARQR